MRFSPSPAPGYSPPGQPSPRRRPPRARCRRRRTTSTACARAKEPVLRLLAGKFDEAMKELHKAIALDPDSETVQNNVRLALAAKGNYAEAIRGVTKDRLPVVLNNVGLVAMQRGDLAVAEGYFTRAMESSPSFNTITSQNIEQLKSKKGDE
jgi:Flp pilus assembly protein TadD